MNVSEGEKLEQQNSGQSNDFERVDNNARQNQIIGDYSDDQITRAVNSAFITVENRMHDLFLTAKGNEVNLRVETAVKLITVLTRHGTNGEVQKPDRRDFLGNTRKTPLMSASSWMDLDNELNRNDETRKFEDFEDGDSPA